MRLVTIPVSPVRWLFLEMERRASVANGRTGIQRSATRQVLLWTAPSLSRNISGLVEVNKGQFAPLLEYTVALSVKRLPGEARIEEEKAWWGGIPHSFGAKMEVSQGLFELGMARRCLLPR